MKNSSIKGADKGEKPWGRTAVGQNRQGCIYFPFYFQVSLNFKETSELKNPQWWREQRGILSRKNNYWNLEGESKGKGCWRADREPAIPWIPAEGAAAVGGATRPGETQMGAGALSYRVPRSQPAPQLFSLEPTPAIGASRHPSYSIHTK